MKAHGPEGTYSKEASQLVGKLVNYLLKSACIKAQRLWRIPLRLDPFDEGIIHQSTDIGMVKKLLPEVHCLNTLPRLP